MSTMRYIQWVAVVLLVGVSGCGDRGAARAERITGRVLLNDKPLAEATVSFRSQEDLTLESAVALTDANGAFELTPNKGSRLKPGKYVALVYKYVDKQGKVVRQVDPNTEQSLRNVVPARYRQPEKSPLLLEIESSADGLIVLPELLLTAP
jgi:hypothetical protein